jgi:hypothetical protein
MDLKARGSLQKHNVNQKISASDSMRSIGTRAFSDAEQRSREGAARAGLQDVAFCAGSAPRPGSACRSVPSDSGKKAHHGSAEIGADVIGGPCFGLKHAFEFHSVV